MASDFAQLATPRQKEKPGVADKIIERTYHFTCPLTDRVMYELMSYRSKRTETTTETTKRVVTAEQDKVFKAAKKAKVAKKALVNTTGGEGGEIEDTNEKLFSTGQKNQLAKMQTVFVKMCTDSETRVADMQDVVAFMPQHLVNKQATFIAAMKIEAAELCCCIEAGRGNFTDIKTKFAESKAGCKEIAARCDTAMVEAKAAKLEVTGGVGGA